MTAAYGAGRLEPPVTSGCRRTKPAALPSALAGAAGRMVLAVCMTAGLSGCTALALGPAALATALTTRYERVDFDVVHAVTGRPAAGATVRVAYHGIQGVSPASVAGATDTRGRVRLRIARGSKASVEVYGAGMPWEVTEPEPWELDPPSSVLVRVRPPSPPPSS